MEQSRNAAGSLIGLLWATRASLLLLLLGLFFLGADQSIDAIRALTDPTVQQASCLLAFVGGVLLVLWNLRFWTDFVVGRYFPVESSSRLLRIGQRYVGLFYAAAFGLGVLFFITRALPGQSGEEAITASNNQILYALLVFIGLCIAVLLYIWQRGSGRPASRQRVRLAAGLMGGIWLVLWLISLLNSAWAVFLGPLGILFAALANWTCFLSLLMYIDKRTRLPVSILLLLLVFVFSHFNWNDNTQIRQRERESQYPPVLAQAFSEWLASRPDTADYPDGYPVFIVAIEGGGIRSAYLGSQVLCRLQDHEPRFADHVFAISGVSGGSVGAALYAALCEQYVRPGSPPGHPPLSWAESGPLEQFSDTILSKDLLSPVLIKTLYSHLFQLLIPFPIKDANPALGLELGLERSWTAATGTELFSQSFYALSNDFAQNSTPALFLNTTSVKTGQRVVISSLYLLEHNYGRFTTLSDLGLSIDLPLSTAAFLSARFPGLTSSGYLKKEIYHDGLECKPRFVDGGYYENSGCATALDLVNALQHGEKVDNRRKFHPVVLRIGYKKGTDKDRKILKEDCNTGSEIRSPLTTIFSARSGRSFDATKQLQAVTMDIFNRAEFHPDQVIPLNDNNELMIEFLFRDGDFAIPLGWMLSSGARESLGKQILAPVIWESGERENTKTALQDVLDRLKPSRTEK